MKTIPLIPPDTAPATSGEPTTPDTRIVADPARTDALKPAIVEAISTVYDPEIPVNIWELGLIYDIAVDASGVAGITMTLTAPGCPAASSPSGEIARTTSGHPRATGP